MLTLVHTYTLINTELRRHPEQKLPPPWPAHVTLMPVLLTTVYCAQGQALTTLHTHVSLYLCYTVLSYMDLIPGHPIIGISLQPP